MLQKQQDRYYYWKFKIKILLCLIKTNRDISIQYMIVLYIETGLYFPVIRLPRIRPSRIDKLRQINSAFRREHVC